MLIAAGAGLGRASYAALERLAPGGRETWTRTNHRGEPVSLLSGPALAISAASSAALGAPAGMRAASLVSGLGAGAVGVYDDIVGQRADQRADKGFAGHLGALREGRVTSGLIKIGGVGLTGLIAAGSVAHGPLDRLVAGGVIAGTANLLNLLDLRPGRALKASVLGGVAGLGGPSGTVVAGPVGASLALLPEDLAEKTMLGDGGANAIGAILGLRLAAAGGPVWRLGALAGLTALTLASEKVSFTKVIEQTPVLREVDALGRRR
ncbi:hypothetical protein EK0264_00555 [Epidermidibacterium keratini]|uniref:UDP-N-acetylmuramyl pentapeptide phosphotransferase/UDP-N-acetylglucosamine-1-phosphate transferase n=2 Tax=Epidermidibacterium keratini TaxID=1891644 RepID=A0A7L4YSX4_9ACTN|nr:hypothetical protein EK0264_00555 [Epidermidibacterium keratini]